MNQAEKYLKETSKNVKDFRKRRREISKEPLRGKRPQSSSPSFFTKKSVKFQNEIKKAEEKFRREARLKWFEFVRSHPEIFHIPNFMSLKKKRLKKQEIIEERRRAEGYVPRSVSVKKKIVKREMNEKEKDILYKKVRGWIQKAMDELENKIGGAEKFLKVKGIHKIFNEKKKRKNSQREIENLG